MNTTAYRLIQSAICRAALVALLVAAATAPGSTARAATPYPTRPIKVIVPFSAGGGSDTFARIIQKAIDDHGLLPEPLVVINVPGAGGTIGSRRVKNARPDGYTVLCLHEGMLTAKHSGKAAYGAEAFEAIAGTSEVGLVIAVDEDSQYADLTALMQAATQKPDTIAFGANIGAPSYFAGLMLEQTAPGARFRYVQSGGGAKRFGALQGGHIDVSAFSVAEYAQFEAGGMRALAVCQPTRHAAIPNVPTAAEQGHHITASNMHYWWAPKGVSPQKIEVLATALRQAMATDYVQRKLRDLRSEATVLTGAELREKIAGRDAVLSAVSQRDTTPLPNLPVIVLAIVIVLTVVVVIESLRTRTSVAATTEQAADRDPPDAASRPGLAVATALLTIAYVASMSVQWIGFRPATVSFALIIGVLLARKNRRLLPAVCVAAVALAFGLHWVFTQVLVTDLP